MKAKKDDKIFEQILAECNGSTDKVNLTKMKNFAERYVEKHPGALDMTAIASMQPKSARKALLAFFCNLNDKPVQKQPVGCEALPSPSPKVMKQVTPTKTPSPKVLNQTKTPKLLKQVSPHLKEAKKSPSSPVVTVNSSLGKYQCTCTKV